MRRSAEFHSVTLDGVTFTHEHIPYCSTVNTLVVGPEAFRFLRKHMGMTGVRLAQVLDVAPETISRWENGKVPVPKLVWFVVSQMAVEYDNNSIETMKTLEGMVVCKVDATEK